MSERYSRLFTLSENLYAVGSPVIIAAGTMLKDNQTGRIVAQLKLRSISDKTIKAVKVKLVLFDTAGNPIGESVTHDYLDLNITRGVEFAQKDPIFISEIKARSYTVSVKEVIFNDKSVWASNEESWESLSKPVPLVFHDAELLKQYQIRFGNDSIYTPMEEMDLWCCTCGEWNHAGEDCYMCRNSLFELQSVDIADLETKKDVRLTEEARTIAIEKARRQKTTTILRIVISLACILVAIVILLHTVILPSVEYNKAVSLMEAGEYEDAITAFQALDSYKDSHERIDDCTAAIEARALAQQEEKYHAALSLMDAGKYQDAIAVFAELGSFRDSTEKIQEAKLLSEYTKAEELLNAGNISGAAMAFVKLGEFQDAKTYGIQLWDSIAVRDSIATGGTGYTVGLRADGTVIAVGFNMNGEYRNISNWKDIIAISAGEGHTIGLKADGAVVAVGFDVWGQCDVSKWTDIVAISTRYMHTVGLKADGTVVASGHNENGECNASKWTDIVAISAGNTHTVGLKSDGTVVAVGSNEYGQCNVSGWQDIVAISAGGYYTVGLKTDGTVVAAGTNKNGRCDVSDWRDIVAIAAGDEHTLGLKADGTVVAAGNNEWGQCDVDNWTGIVALSAEYNHTVGLKADGTVVAVGYNEWGQCDVSEWKDIKIPH